MPAKSRNPNRQTIPSRISESVLFTQPVLTPKPPKPLPPTKALTDYKQGISESQKVSFHIPRPIIEATLSGAQMSVDGGWLEVGGDGVRVYGDTGEIHWFKNPVPSAGAWMNIYLAGIQAGATYVGQIRCFTNPIPTAQYHIALKVVIPGPI